MHNRLYKIIIKSLLLVGLILLLTLGHITSFYTHHANEQQDCIVVFGAAVWPGYFGPVASNALADRTLEAVTVYQQGLADCIILSGGASIYGAHEVDIMTDILLEEGIPEKVIQLDRDGVNTLATIQNLDTARSYILISNDFHLARIGLLAQRHGLSQNGFTLHAATYQSGGRYIKEYYFTFREVVAWWYYFFITII